MKSSGFKLKGPLLLDLTNVDVPFKKDATVLLDLPIPPALWGINPRKLLGKAWWDNMRKMVYKRNGGFCLACNAGEIQLEAHERYDYDLAHRISKFKEIIPLCHKCHQFIHWRSIENRNHQRSILMRGMNILKDAKLVVPESCLLYTSPSPRDRS